jgi:hypothetical protein
MRSEPLSKILLTALECLLDSNGDLLLQRIFLASLAHTDKFSTAANACLLAAAEVTGDDDEILPEVLADYLAQRRAAQRQANGE